MTGKVLSGFKLIDTILRVHNGNLERALYLARYSQGKLNVS